MKISKSLLVLFTVIFVTAFVGYKTGVEGAGSGFLERLSQKAGYLSAMSLYHGNYQLYRADQDEQMRKVFD